MITVRFAAGFKSSRVLLALVAVALSAGCADSPSTGPPETPPSIEFPRPAGLLTTVMEQAFANRDSILVAWILHEEFTCLTLQEDGDSLRDTLGSDWAACDKTLYLRSVGRLFRDPTVTGMTLDVLILENLPSVDEDCRDCRQLETTWTLRITTLDDANEPVTYVVDAPMTFHVARDTQNPQKWVLWKQINRSSPLTTQSPELAGWFDCCEMGGTKP
jgi:hypothetical protein